MSDFGQQIILKQLLDRHGRVEVPRIQRDYAQGREAAADVREEFLSALFEALNLPKDDPKLPLNLDFIYGSVEGKDSTSFLPLDGQQRLTTLFLLHWYAGWKDNSADQFQRLLCDQNGSRFSYSVRPSSSEFFDALSKFQPEAGPADVADLGALLRDQAWYFRHWRLDPTIQSALSMLDSIHERFQGCENMFSRLVDEAQPAITFQLLDLANFGLSDDLYIKMNARGKPLTAFETFKARYEQALGEQFGDATRPIAGQEFPVAEYFSRRMDTDWADFFWEHRNQVTSLFDDAVMSVFRCVILISRNPESSSFVEDVRVLRSRVIKTSYVSFHDKGWIDRDFSIALFVLLETWIGPGSTFKNQLPNTRYFDEKSVFNTIANQPWSLAYSEVVKLVAYVDYLKEHGGDKTNRDAFQEWMRIVHNLSVNTSYNRPEDFQRSISGVRSMLAESADILRFFAENPKPSSSGFNLQQINEERLKAHLILGDNQWRPLIDRAEGHGYFDGQIEFLFDFAGVLSNWRSGNTNLSADVHSKYLKKFERNLILAETMFTDTGLKKDPSLYWQRALLSIGDFLLQSGHRNESFLVNTSTEQGSWKRLLRGSESNEPTSRAMLGELWERLDSASKISPQLDAIIADTGDAEPWRKAIIEHPEAISYCSRRLIRRNSDTEIYLLTKTQMNGLHAELFTYCLFLDLKNERFANDLKLRMEPYYESNETAIEPGIRFSCQIDGEEHLFELEHRSDSYLIYRNKKEDEEFPKYVESLVKDAGFTVWGNKVRIRCSDETVRDAIVKLDHVLSDHSGGQAKDA